MTEETVLVTGCSSGIGRATSALFVDQEWTVYATARDEATIADLADEQCHTAELDVTSADDVDRVVDRIVAEQGHLQCLVNSAGYAQYGPMEDIDTDRLHRQFEVAMYGPHRLARAVLPHMREAGTGTIVTVSCAAGRLALPGTGAFSAATSAREAAHSAMRGEVASSGVHVVLVEPGPVRSNYADRARTELAGIERTDAAYGWLYDLLEDAGILGNALPIATEPSAVAATIHEAAESTAPRDRYRVGRLPGLLALARALPPDLRDRAARVVRRLV